CLRPWSMHPEPYGAVANATPSLGTVLVAVRALQRPYDTSHGLALGKIVGDDSATVLAITGGLTIEAMGHALKSAREGLLPSDQTKIAVNAWVPEPLILHRQG